MRFFRKYSGKILVYGLLCIGVVAFLFPLVWMVSTSLKSNAEVMQATPSLFPKELQWDNYKQATASIPFWRYAMNSLLVCTLSVTGTVCSSVLVAYGFARLEWRGRDNVFALVLATMIIPFPVLMVPQFVIFSELGMIGSLKPLWVPTFFGSAFNIFLLRQFFRTIPKDLSEAARIDGCSELGILCRIILPLSKAPILVVALFQFIASWNDFLGPLIYLTRQESFTLSLGLQFFQGQHGGTQWNLLMATATLMTLPIMLMYFFTQKSFIEGIASGGVKG